MINNISNPLLNIANISYSQNEHIDYQVMFDDFAPYAEQIYRAFISYNPMNYFFNLAKLSADNGPLTLKKFISQIMLGY